ncbi:hypothetical protein AVEN_185478-1, partial [Araneus ventricosus]
MGPCSQREEPVTRRTKKPITGSNGQRSQEVPKET